MAEVSFSKMPSRKRPNRVKGADRALAGLVWAGVLLVFAVFCWIVGDLTWKGISGVSWTFLVESPRDAGRAGGIAPVLVSTGLILLVCLAGTVPLGMGAAVCLAEFVPRRGRFAGLVRRSLDVLAGVPSIVFGLFGNALFCVYLDMGFSILSGGLTLACMALPLFIRSAEEGFRAVPDDQRHAAAALGLSRRATLARILLPQALPGLTVGLALSVGRALAETAALIFTSGYVDRMPTSLFDSGRALSIHIYDLSMNVPGGEDNAYATALVLVGLLLLINLAAGQLAHRFLHRGAAP
jgi:phosphate transport system permease protein